MKYIKCPKCELNYIDADKQSVCSVCQEDREDKTHKYTKINEPARYNGRAIFFVFQNKDFYKESATGIIKAPYYDKGGDIPHHWLRLTKVKKGDIIFHCVDGRIQALSESKGEYRDFLYVDGSQGRKIECDYHILNTSLKIENYRDVIITYCSKYEYQPFNKNGTGNQGYLFDICREVAKIFLSDIVNCNRSLATMCFIKDILELL